jgi:hypothetical protein
MSTHVVKVEDGRFELHDFPLQYFSSILEHRNTSGPSVVGGSYHEW